MHGSKTTSVLIIGLALLAAALLVAVGVLLALRQPSRSAGESSAGQSNATQPQGVDAQESSGGERDENQHFEERAVEPDLEALYNSTFDIAPGEAVTFVDGKHIGPETEAGVYELSLSGAVNLKVKGEWFTVVSVVSSMGGHAGSTVVVLDGDRDLVWSGTPPVDYVPHVSWYILEVTEGQGNRVSIVDYQVPSSDGEVAVTSTYRWTGSDLELVRTVTQSPSGDQASPDAELVFDIVKGISAGDDALADQYSTREAMVLLDYPMGMSPRGPTWRMMFGTVLGLAGCQVAPQTGYESTVAEPGDWVCYVNAAFDGSGLESASDVPVYMRTRAQGTPEIYRYAKPG